VVKKLRKFLKYKDLIKRFSACGIRKPKLIAVIIGATETFSNSLRQYLSNTPGTHEI